MISLKKCVFDTIGVTIKAKIPFYSIEQNEVFGKSSDNGVGEGAIQRKERFVFNHHFYRRATITANIIQSPIKIRNSHHLQSKKHSKTFSDCGIRRTVNTIADNMCIFMKSDTFYRLIINGKNLVGETGESIAGFLVTVRNSDLPGVAQRVYWILKSGVTSNIRQIKSKHSS